MPKQPKPKPIKRNKPKAIMAKMTQPGVTADPLCSSYCQTLCNPFVPTSCGVPAWPAEPSRNVHIWVRGTTVASSSEKFMFVLFNPKSSIINSGFAEDAFCVYTGAHNYGDTMFQRNGAVAGVQEYASNSPYNASFFDNANHNRWRMVSAGLRVRYTGTEMARGGTLVGLNRPNLSGERFADLMKYPFVHSVPVEKKWTTVLWAPRNPDDMAYQGIYVEPSIDAPQVLNDQYFELGICGNVADATAGGTFEFECFANFEVTGESLSNVIPRSVTENIYTVAGAFRRASGNGSAMNETETAASMKKVMTALYGSGVKVASYLGEFAGDALAVARPLLVRGVVNAAAAYAMRGGRRQQLLRFQNEFARG